MKFVKPVAIFDVEVTKYVTGIRLKVRQSLFKGAYTPHQNSCFIAF